MAFENTITENDLDANARHLAQTLRTEDDFSEMDLAVDGLSDSLLSRLMELFRPGRIRR